MEKNHFDFLEGVFNHDPYISGISKSTVNFVFNGNVDALKQVHVCTRSFEGRGACM